MCTKSSLNRWSDDWDRVLKDRRKPLQVRLTALYKSYYATVDRMMLSGFRCFGPPWRKDRHQLSRICAPELIIPIAAEIRAEFGLPSTLTRPISILEEQIVYSLHAKFLYSLIRKHVYGHDTGTNMNFLIEIYVDAFFNSLEMSITRIFKLEDAENIANRVGASVD